LKYLKIIYKISKRGFRMKKFILLGIIILSFLIQAESLTNQGIKYYKNNDYKRAEEYFLKGIEKNEKNSFFALGTLYQEQKKYDKAEQMYLKAIENGFGMIAFNNLGYLYYTR
jgi:tetratricopeptide repeat protein